MFIWLDYLECIKFYMFVEYIFFSNELVSSGLRLLKVVSFEYALKGKGAYKRAQVPVPPHRYWGGGT